MWFTPKMDCVCLVTKFYLVTPACQALLDSEKTSATSSKFAKLTPTKRASQQKSCAQYAKAGDYFP